MSDELSLRAAAREVPARVALVAEGRSYSYQELGTRVAGACEKLTALGLTPRSLVAVHASSRVETLVALHALIELGIPFVPIDPRLTPAEAAALLEDAAPDAVLDSTAVAATSEPGAALEPGETAASAALLAMVYTSGTTGRAKGALLSRAAFLASARASAANLGSRPDDRWLLCLPLSHVGGLSIVTRSLCARSSVVLVPRFEPAAVLEAVVSHEVTLLSVVPATLHALLAEDRLNQLRHLHAILVGGAAAPFELLQECARRGVMALATYGLTEACSQVTTQRPARPPCARRGSGHPVLGIELAITDDAGAALDPGTEGHVCVRGPTMMDGYRNRAPLAGRWFDTGDLGTRDADGVLHVHARRTDLIVTGGENVYPAEVELALEQCPGVERAFVFGVADERFGQLVAAAIVANPASPVDEARLQREIGARLAPYKHPRRLCTTSALPQTSSGKLDRATAAARFSPLLRPFRP